MRGATCRGNFCCGFCDIVFDYSLRMGFASKNVRKIKKAYRHLKFNPIPIEHLWLTVYHWAFVVSIWTAVLISICGSAVWILVWNVVCREKGLTGGVASLTPSFNVQKNLFVLTNFRVCLETRDCIRIVWLCFQCIEINK